MFGGSQETKKLKIETYEDLLEALKGDPGAAGIGIHDVTVLESSEYDKKLVIQLTDDRQFVFDLPKGIPGQDGNTPVIDYNKIISEVTGKTVEQVTALLPKAPSAEEVANKLKELGLVKDGNTPIIDYNKIIAGIDVPKPVVVPAPTVQEIAEYVKESGLIKDGETPVIDIEAIKQEVIQAVKPEIDINDIIQVLYNKIIGNIELPKAPTLAEILPGLIEECKKEGVIIPGAPGKNAPFSEWLDIHDCMVVVSGKSKNPVQMTNLESKRYMVNVIGSCNAIGAEIGIWNNFSKTFIVDASKGTVNTKVLFDEKSHSDLSLTLEVLPGSFGLFYNNPTDAEMQLKMKVEVYAT